MKKGKLIFVGLGIKAISHITLEAKSWIEYSDIVIYHVADLITEGWIKGLNANCISLNNLYVPDKSRLWTYKKMVEQILEPVNKGKTVCVALYGNPAFYVYATHKAAKLATKNGHYVEVNAGISSLDCLFADLDIDIVNEGLLIVEATSVLSGYKRLDLTSYVVLMQPGPVGEARYKNGAINKNYLTDLQKILIKNYGKNHFLYVYHAATYPVSKPHLKKIRIGNLNKNLDIYLATLCIPPKSDTHEKAN